MFKRFSIIIILVLVAFLPKAYAVPDGKGDEVFPTSNVGIGTTTPQTALAITNGNVGIGTWTAAGGNLIINGGGNVGIGSAWPGQTLDVQGDVRANYFIGNGSMLSGLSGLISGLTPGYVPRAATPTTIANGDIFDNGIGNIGIGSLVPGQALDVQGTVRMTGFTLSNNGAAAGNVLVTNGVGMGTWMAASTLSISGGTSSQWITTAGVGIGTWGNVGVGTITPQAGLVVTNGNVGIGTWTAAGGSLIVQSGNVGIGSAWPGATLDVNGSLRVSGAGNVVTYFNTNVGINSSSPGAALDINGAARMSGFQLSNSPVSGDILMTNGVGVGTWVPSSSVATTTLPGGLPNQLQYNNGGIFGGIANSNVDINGNVGIGSTVPGQILDVQGTVRTTFFTLSGNGAGAGNVMVSNGVGMGTWMPTSTLGISGGSGSNFWINDTGNIGINTTYNVGIGTIAQVNSLNILGNIGIGTFSYDPFMKNAAPNGGMIISGNVGIGTWAPSALLDVNGNGILGISNSITDVITSSGTGSLAGGEALHLGASIGSITSSGGGSIAFGWVEGTNFLGPKNSLLLSSGNGSIAMGDMAEGTIESTSSGSVAIGLALGGGAGPGFIGSTNAGSVAMGVAHSGTLQATNSGSIAMGDSELGTLQSTGVGSVAMGFANSAILQATGNGSVAIGDSVQANATDAEAFGLNVVNNIPDTFMVGFNVNPTLTVTSANVGIGSLTPGQALDVQGTVRTMFLAMSGQTPVSGYVLTASDSAGDTTWTSAGSVGGWTVTGNNVYETSSGNVGIGTSALQTALAITNGNVGIGTWTAAGGNLIVNGGGNVGIGSAWPGTTLDVNGTIRSNLFESNTALASAPGAVALGLAGAPGELTATGNGTFVMGYAQGTQGSITASSAGDVAMGTAAGGPSNGQIISGGGGSFALGVAVGASGTGILTSTGTGSFSMGYTWGPFTNSTISSMGSGSFAMGYAGDGETNLAKGNASFAMGENVQAINGNTFAIGQNVINGYNGSFMVGFASTPTLTVSANVGIGTVNPFGGKLIVASGNVGIGSLTPGQALDVQGTVRTMFLTMSGQTPVSGYVLTASDSAGDTTWTTPGDVGGWTVTGNNVYETSSGNVGIGTSALQTALAITNGNVGIGTWTAAGGNLIINGGGNVGIGSVWPGTILDVNGVVRGTGFSELGTIGGANSTSLGAVLGGGTINSSNGLGQLAGGFSWLSGGTSAVISSTNAGSIAYGESLATPGETSLISSTSNGSVAIGFSQNSTLVSSGSGSIAMGYAFASTLQATGAASVAIGESVQAIANNAFALGVGVVNPNASSLMVGFNATPTLTVTGTGVGIGTSSPFGGSLIVASGNVGISSLTPGQALDVQGTVRTTFFTLSGNGAGAGNVMVSNGVGMGTWMPTSTLGISGGSGSNLWLNDIGNIGINTSYNIGVGTISQINSLNILGNIGIGTFSYDPFMKNAAPSGGMIISGNVGIGTWATSALFQVNGNSILGFANSSVDSLTSNGTGSLAGGEASHNGGVLGNIKASSPGSLAFGFAQGNTANSTIIASNTGSIALGGTFEGTLQSSGVGSVALGNVLGGGAGPGALEATNNGSVAIGYVDSGTMQATQAGSIAMGDETQGFLQSSAAGSIAMGFANGSTLQSTGAGSIAMGYSNGGTLQASGDGSVAIGDTVQATATDAEAFGLNVVNNISDTFMVGFKTTPTLTVTSANVGIGSTNPGQALDVQGTVRTTFFTLSGNGAGSGNVMVSNGVGMGTWMPASTLNTGSAGVNYWLVDNGNVGINTAYNVGIGTIAQTNSLNVLGNIGVGTEPYSSFLTIAAPIGGGVFEGNVGIGTWAPSDLLNVSGNLNGSVRITTSNYNSNSGAYAVFKLVTDSGFGTVFRNSSTNTAYAGASSINLANISNGPLGLITNNILRLYIDSGGNVGIGSQAPGQLLDVQGTVRMTGFTLSGNGAAAGNVMVTNGVGVGTWMAASTLAVSGGTGTNYWLQTTGVGIGTYNNVGIGTVTPQGALVVTNGNVGIGTWVPVDTFQVGKYSSTGSGFEVDSNGNVGIGTTLTMASALSVMDGNVGIGTWVPAGTLELNKSVMSGLGPVLYLRNTGGFGLGHIDFQTCSNCVNPTARWEGSDDGNYSANQIFYGNAGGGPGAALVPRLWIGGSTAGVGVSTITPKSTFDVAGSVSVGSYGGINAAPTNGLIVSGNVGVGSSNPGQALDVQGTVRTMFLTMSGQTPVSGYVMTASDSAGDTTWTSAGTESGWTVTGNNVYETSSGNVGIGTNLVTAGALIVMNGNVGIGTWVPGQNLDVNGNIRIIPSSGALYFSAIGANANGNYVVGNESSTGDMKLYTSNTLRMDLTLAGNIGIGTTNPQGGLAVMNGNVGIGTWVPGNSLDVVGGNIGIGTAYNLVGIGTTSTILTLRTDKTSIYAGWESGAAINTGNRSNSALGYQALNSDTSGNVNSAVGYQALYSNTTGYGNDALGDQALYSNISGYYNVAMGNGALYSDTGFQNSAVGFFALYFLNGTNDNTALGYSAGIHYTGGGNVTTPSQSTFLGDSTEALANGDSNETVIGYGAIGNGTNTVTLGNTSVVSTILEGNVGIGTFNPFGGNLIVKGGGNVGIGSLVPGQALDVQGTVRTTGFTLSGNGAAAGNLLVTNGVGMGTWMPVSSIGGAISGLTTNYVTKASSPTSITTSTVLYDTGTNIGIGVTTPAQLLEVNGGMQVDATGNSYFSAGNVGIGSVSPGVSLDVQGTVRMLGFALSNNGAAAGNVLVTNGVGIGTWMAPGVIGAGGISGLTTGTIPQAASSSTLSNSVITQLGGNIGIGVGSPSAPLEVNGAIAADGSGNSSFSSGNLGIGTTTPQAAFVVTDGNVGIGTWTANSGLQMTQSFAFYRTATAASVSSAGQTIIGVTDTTSARTITLANADKVVGRVVIIKDESGGAGTNNITITPASGTIDGAASVVISVNYGVVRLYSDGTNWFTF